MIGPEHSRWRAGVTELVVFVAGYLAAFATIVGAGVLAHPRSWSWGGMVDHVLPALGGVLGGVIARLLRSPERRRFDHAVTKALWAGTLPSAVEPAEWGWHLRRQVSSAGAVRWALIPLGVGGGAVTAIAAATTDHGAPGVWALAAGQEFAALALLWACVRLIRNGRRLLAQLRAES